MTSQTAHTHPKTLVSGCCHRHQHNVSKPKVHLSEEGGLLHRPSPLPLGISCVTASSTGEVTAMQLLCLALCKHIAACTCLHAAMPSIWLINSQS